MHSYEKGVQSYQQGNFTLAIQQLTSAIEADPTHKAAYNDRGTAFKKVHQYQSAIQDYSSAISLDPSYSIAF